MELAIILFKASPDMSMLFVFMPPFTSIDINMNINKMHYFTSLIAPSISITDMLESTGTL